MGWCSILSSSSMLFAISFNQLWFSCGRWASYHITCISFKFIISFHSLNSRTSSVVKRVELGDGRPQGLAEPLPPLLSAVHSLFLCYFTCSRSIFPLLSLIFIFCSLSHPGGLELDGIHVPATHWSVPLRREPAGEVFLLTWSKVGLMQLELP